MGRRNRWMTPLLVMAASCGGGASGPLGPDPGQDLPAPMDLLEDFREGPGDSWTGRDVPLPPDGEEGGDAPSDGTGNPEDADPGTGEEDGSDPGQADPGTPDRGGFDLAPADHAGKDPGSGDEGPKDPDAADPDSGDPEITDPGSADPAPSDSGATDPAPSDPAAGEPGGDSSAGAACERPPTGLLLDPAWAAGPRPGTWSWNGSWNPRDSDFPLAGLYDDEYFDGHRVEGRPTPVLPPGRWDWNDADDDLANWRNFYTNLGEFLLLRDGCDRAFGWRFLPKDPEAVDFSGPGEYFEGSSGMDLLLLGPNGNLSSITGSLGGGPDVLVFGRAWSLDYRTGSTGVPGADRDDDLVVAGCVEDAGLEYPVRTMTIHGGPGADVLFARNIRAAALDAGNGAGGRTDTLDPTDGDDRVILGGNVKDVRVFGGHGNDVLFWYADQMNEPTPFQGGDFFGGGGYGDAVFGDPGIDRLVLVVPGDTRIVDRPASPPQRGTLLVMRENGGSDEPWYDEPTLQDPYARYCITCGRGPGGERTLFVQYASADGRIDTGYVSVTAFEELQVGVGSGARVYRLDNVVGRAVAAPDLAPLEAPAYPYGWCDLR